MQRNLPFPTTLIDPIRIESQSPTPFIAHPGVGLVVEPSLRCARGKGRREGGVEELVAPVRQVRGFLLAGEGEEVVWNRQMVA